MNRHSLRVRLPFIMSALITVVLGAFLWVSFRQIEKTLVRSGAVRAQAAAEQLSGLLAQQQQQRLALLQRAAETPAVIDFVARGGAEDAARAKIATIAAAGQPPVELWSESGRRMLSVEGPPARGRDGDSPAAKPGLPDTAMPAAAGLSEFRAADGVVYWDAVAEIQEQVIEEGEPNAGIGFRRAGFILSRGYLAGSADSSETIKKLVGAGAVLKIGNKSGTVWTDLAGVVPAPPVQAAEARVTTFRAADGEERIGANTPIRGTPWAVWIEFPSAAFAEPARTYLAGMVGVSVLFVGLAAAIAYVLSSRITTPLQDLTTAAEAIAGGADQRVDVVRRDEIGRLATSFNVMTAKLREAQRELEGDLNQFFNLSPDMLAIADLEGRFVRVNAAWTATLGWSAEELCGRPYVEFVHPEDRAVTTSESDHLAGGVATTTFQNRYLCKDGSSRWLQWNATPVLERGAIYAVARDITAQKADAEAIRDLNAQLEKRVSDLDVLTHELEAFSYSVSHDLRAPLRHVTGFAQLLEASSAAALDDKGKRYLKTITDSATRMGRLIDDLLVFSRMGRTEMMRTRVDLAALVEDVKKEATVGQSDRRVAWTIHPLPVVTGDPSMLRLVLMNLVSNALKYSSTRETAEVEIGCNGTTQEAVFFVRDNGVGFDMQYAHKLFGVFQRLHSADEFEGTGIGLANVRRIVQRHGGRVWAEGAPDRGATFSFSLPQPGGIL